MLRRSLANLGIHKKILLSFESFVWVWLLSRTEPTLTKNTMLKNNMYLQSMIADVGNWWETRKKSANTSFRNKCCLAHGRWQHFYIHFFLLFIFINICIDIPYFIQCSVYAGNIYRSEMLCARFKTKIKMLYSKLTYINMHVRCLSVI